jgi:guanylate kinase
MPGKLIILSGPSGAGKSTIAKYLLNKPEYNLSFSVSACSRKKREGETEGADYYFMTVDSFKSKIEENEFLEWEEVYPSMYYGTLKSEVEKLRSMGKNVLFDVDVMGGINIKRKYKEEAISIFIKPPSLEILEERLLSRKTETPEHISKRVRKAKMELAYANKFDHLIVNEKLEEAMKEADRLAGQLLNV